MIAVNALTKSCYFVDGYSCYEVIRDFASPLLTFLAILFSFLIAFFQLSKQHRNTLKLKKEETKSNTRIELFKEINGLLEFSNTKIREVHSFCFGKKYSTAENKAELNQAEFIELMNKFSNALLVVASKVESHEIVNLKLFRVFRFALYAIHHDLLALQMTKDKPKILDDLIKLSNDSMLYFGDFQICMQNMAYGDVFCSEVPKRVPADKKMKVITNCPDNLEYLYNYFDKESNWGKNCTKYENEVKEKYS